MKKMTCCVLFVSAALLGCANKPVQSHESSHLCARLPSDLADIDQSLAQNFSGYADSPEIRKLADSAYSAAVAESKQCQSDADYLKAIKRFIASFKDPHVAVRFAKLEGVRKELFETTTGMKAPEDSLSIQYVATGVYLQKYGDRFFVKSIDTSLAPKEIQVGEELISCSHKTPAEILKNEILPYTAVSAMEAAEYNATPNIFFRWDQEPGSSISCDFLQNKISSQATLTWSRVSENYLKEKFAPEPKDIYSLEKTKFGHWVTLKSLAGYSPEMNVQLKKFADDAKKLRRDKVIVVDLRGNGGGNSSWAKAWIQNLIGHKFDLRGGTDFVLASPGNIRHFENLHTQLLKTNGISGEEKHWGILLAALHKNPGKISPLEEEPNPVANKKDAGKFKGKIYLLTDAGVFSSGEVFTEMLRALPCTIQVGTSTNASTNYSDIRFDITTHGLIFSFPTMGEHGGDHQRASGEGFVPSIRIEKDPALESAGQDSQRLALEDMIAQGAKR